MRKPVHKDKHKDAGKNVKPAARDMTKAGRDKHGMSKKKDTSKDKGMKGY